MSDVYLIHLERKVSGRAQHYIGIADELDVRIEQHRTSTWTPPDEPGLTGTTCGGGTPLLAAANYYGIPWRVALVFHDKDRTFERQLKNCKNARRYCPACNVKPRNYQPKGT